ncbi:selenocysteine-specific translation elongation factor [Yimella sp. cx-573]|nr:selenocysteine-specific translation elongation factor [Yimella sp. cx-573]
MRVIATAGHVDHGKSTLVRALTGTDPDRWAEEHQRGLTIDLGFVWTTLPSGEDVAFVDVPGHQRFIANTLAGIGPVPAVMLIVSADEGWRRQTQEHFEAIRALGVRHLLVAVTRSDLTDPEPVIADVRKRLAANGFDDVDIIPVSAITGSRLDELRVGLDRLIDALPEPDVHGRVRMWIDRVFSIRGAGTVVTGTLGSGTLRVGDAVSVAGRAVSVRRIQSLEQPRDQVAAVARVAVNLRGIETTDVERGDLLLGAGEWHRTHVVDVRLGGAAPEDLPGELMAHVGTTAFQVRVRPLGGDAVRLQWHCDLPLLVGDRLVLRDPGRQQVLGGAVVLDLDPPAFTRRGAARRRAEELADHSATVDAVREVARRGYMRAAELQALGGEPSDAVRQVGEWLVDPGQWSAWITELESAVDSYAAAHPLRPQVPTGVVADAISLPATELVRPLASEAGLVVEAGEVSRPGMSADLGGAEAGIAEIERRLADAPFAAPDRADLSALDLGPKQLAAAVRLGRLIDLGDQILLSPGAPALAMRALAALRQPFTTSQARQALGTTRRVVIPLLEHLDAKGWTRRIDAGHREVVR